MRAISAPAPRHRVVSARFRLPSQKLRLFPGLFIAVHWATAMGPNISIARQRRLIPDERKGEVEEQEGYGTRRLQNVLLTHTHTRLSTLMDDSEQESINSYNSRDSMGQVPHTYVPSTTTTTSAARAGAPRGRAGSETGSETSSAARLRLVPTETVRSLQELGVSPVAPIPDVNAPTTVGTGKAIFPEEYTMETATGLVPVATLQSLGRTQSGTLAATRSRTRRQSFAAAAAAATDSAESGSGSDERKPSGGDADADADGPDGLDAALPTSMPEYDPDIEFVTFVTNDPENPHNWPLWLRWSYTIVMSVLVISVAYGSACITGGLGTVSDKYHVSLEVSILTCSLMVIGFSLGPLIWSPVSDLYGRRVAYFTSLGLYVIFNIPCALAPNIGCLLACRFLCGVWASSGLCLVGGSIADMFPPETRGRAIAFFAYAPYCGPVFGPLVNGFISVSTERMDLIFWVNMAFAGVMWLIVALIPETYAPVILKWRAARLRRETGNPKIMTEQEAQGLSVREMVSACLLRPLYLAATEPVLDLMCFYVCLIYSLLYAFFFAYPVIFGELYGYKDNIIGLMFIPILIGASVALATTTFCENQYLKITKHRNPTPEDRLLGAMIGAPFAAIALWILGATSYKHIIWVGPASSGLAFGYGMVLIYYSLNNYIIDCYAMYASGALATKVFLRSAGGAAFPLFTDQMYHKLGLQWASWLLAFISTAMILIPFGFYYYGKDLRAKLSKKNYAFSGME
ncbi:LAME_0H19240g1_1 [Lachancea meyersii CBS 8951]|uniref:LAME_0H19240g1_1 n=1 Tax=Lachancea meyersii CBS 8951 TaxID=1266667 RepID=A0A1G4KJ00_9SACH|nr:LAME_0H19240g1_1 [Lachancea meyersii CBS 8951]